MKKILIVLTVVLLITAGMTGCSDEYDKGILGGAPIFVEPLYVGETITTVDKVFTKDDFNVMVNYDDGTHRVVTDYEITECTLKNGVYMVMVEWRGIEGDAMVFPDDSLFYGTQTPETETTEETTAETEAAAE